MNTTMTERFNGAGALLVKLFGRPDDEARSFSDRAGRVRDIGIISAMYSRTFFVALTLVASMATALVYGMGGWLAITNGLNVGTVVALSALLGRLYGPLTALSNVRVDVMTALVSFERVFEVLDLPPMIDESPRAVPLPPDPRSIEFDDVQFSYPTAAEVSLASLEDVAVLDNAPSQQVLHGVSFRAEPGQLVALVGPSGAGKTTISQLPTRMYDVRAGADVVHPGRELGDGGLAGAGGTYQSDQLPGLGAEADAVQHLLGGGVVQHRHVLQRGQRHLRGRGVAELHVIELDRAGVGRQWDRPRTLVDHRRKVEHLEDPLEGDQSGHHINPDVGQRGQRPVQPAQQRGQGNHGADV